MNLGNKISMDNDIDRLPLTLTVDEVAHILRISKKSAYELVHSKTFPSFTVGRRILVPKAALQTWLENPNQN